MATAKGQGRCVPRNIAENSSIGENSLFVEDYEEAMTLEEFQVLMRSRTKRTSREDITDVRKFGR